MVCLHPIHHIIRTATRESEIVSLVFCTADDAWYIPYRHSHGLISIILRVSEGGDALELVLSAIGEAMNGDIYAVCQCDFDGRGNILRLELYLLPLPWFAILFVIFRAQRSERGCVQFRQNRFNLFFVQLSDAGQVHPLIRIGLHLLIREQAAAMTRCCNLQGKRNQVAKAALGHGILIGKHAVIGME